MVDNEPGRIRYARVTEGMAAGTIEVDLGESREHSTQVSVTYDPTALTHAGENWLEAFDADYDAAIADPATETPPHSEEPDGETAEFRFERAAVLAPNLAGSPMRGAGYPLRSPDSRQMRANSRIDW